MPERNFYQSDRSDGADKLGRPFGLFLVEIRVGANVNVAQIECVFQKRYENAAERGSLSEEDAGLCGVPGRDDEPYAQLRGWGYLGDIKERELMLIKH